MILLADSTFKSLIIVNEVIAQSVPILDRQKDVKNQSK